MPGAGQSAESGAAAEQLTVWAKGLAKAGNPFGEWCYVTEALVGRMFDFKKTSDGKPTKIAARYERGIKYSPTPNQSS
ncbi:MAG: hypothetical protein LBD30_06665 [Verrucomicrobiales bacterium]|jgi:hypothetical protein|nr:hypothetical protein [Verrucomicrobiales bacterium]